MSGELPGPSDQRPVARDLVVLDRLRAADNGGIENLLVLNLAGDVVSFADETIDRRQLVPFGRSPRFSKTLSRRAT